MPSALFCAPVIASEFPPWFLKLHVYALCSQKACCQHTLHSQIPGEHGLIGVGVVYWEMAEDMNRCMSLCLGPQEEHFRIRESQLLVAKNEDVIICVLMSALRVNKDFGH